MPTYHGYTSHFPMPTLKHLEGLSPSTYQLSTTKQPESIIRRIIAMMHGSTIIEEAHRFSDGAIAARLKVAEAELYLSWDEGCPLLMSVYVAHGINRRWQQLFLQKIANYNLQAEHLLHDLRAKATEVKTEEGKVFWRTIFNIRETFDGATQAEFAGDKSKFGLLTAICNMETFLGNNPSASECRLFLSRMGLVADRALSLLNTIDLKAAGEDNQEIL